MIDREINAARISVCQQIKCMFSSIGIICLSPLHLFIHLWHQVLPSMIAAFAEAASIVDLLALYDHAAQSQVTFISEPAYLCTVQQLLPSLLLLIEAFVRRDPNKRWALQKTPLRVELLTSTESVLHGFGALFSGSQIFFAAVEPEDAAHVSLWGYFGIHEFQQIDVILSKQEFASIALILCLSTLQAKAEFAVRFFGIAHVRVVLVLQVMIKVWQVVLVHNFLDIGPSLAQHQTLQRTDNQKNMMKSTISNTSQMEDALQVERCVDWGNPRYKRKVIIGEMSERVRKFAQSLRERHYSSAFVQHLVEAITDDPKITTLQEVYEVVQKQSQLVIDYFGPDSDLRLIDFRTPLCFESIRDYFHTMTRGVYKKHGSDINRFREGLRAVAKELIDIMAASTSRIVKHSEMLLRDGTPKKVLVYGYSRSIGLSLKRLAKSLEDNLTVYVCRSGSLEDGIKLHEELMAEGVKSNVIGDNELGYCMPEMSCVLVGAQVILDNGAVLSRAGTSVVALLAHAIRKPFYVFAESYKFLRRNYLCQRDIPQRYIEDRRGNGRSIAFDLTPPEHITVFCTDNGLYNPQIIALELAKILK